ncbi:hypothetical protein PHLCEN_2v12539 [Hermanssonia centrifuga]|uniref:Uncharacterized protein n=1 Tax=Hermanssonia centrifuga TaxID=98765 RepID=A0A2R6NGS5_9APHY|nr:hypothetical protein PHLCEN_2v12539 [Hermanssonia centrifuga]
MHTTPTISFAQSRVIVEAYQCRLGIFAQLVLLGSLGDVFTWFKECRHVELVPV